MWPFSVPVADRRAEASGPVSRLDHSESSMRTRLPHFLSHTLTLCVNDGTSVMGQASPDGYWLPTGEWVMRTIT